MMTISEPEKMRQQDAFICLHVLSQRFLPQNLLIKPDEDDFQKMMLRRIHGGFLPGEKPSKENTQSIETARQESIKILAGMDDLSLPMLIQNLIRHGPQPAAKNREPRFTLLEKSIKENGLIIDNKVPFLFFKPGRIDNVEKEFFTIAELKSYELELICSRSEDNFIPFSSVEPLHEDMVFFGQEFYNEVIAYKKKNDIAVQFNNNKSKQIENNIKNVYPAFDQMN